MSAEIKLSQLYYALSRTIDLVGDDNGHGKRVAQMAYQLGKQLDFEQSDLDELFLAALFHDIGVSSSYVHSHLVNELEWKGVHDHCLVGAKLVEQTEELASLSAYILHHHDRWPILLQKKVDIKVAVFCNIILLVDRVDAFAWQYLVTNQESYYLYAKDFVLQNLETVKEQFFSEDIYQAFLVVSEADAFWLMNDNDPLKDFVLNRLSKIETKIDVDELKRISNVFANAVDAKSTYTYSHSKGVAALSRFVAEKMNLEQEQCERLEIAGLLHDLGKLDIPDELIEKHSGLTDQERTLMDRHSFISQQILGNVEGIEDIALWVSQHHEKLDGSGYPFKNRSLPIESRILVVSDIFQALAQDRPYRDSLPADVIIDMLNEQVKEGKLDAYVVACVEEHLSEAYRICLLQNR